MIHHKFCLNQAYLTVMAQVADEKQSKTTSNLLVRKNFVKRLGIIKMLHDNATAAHELAQGHSNLPGSRRF